MYEPVLHQQISASGDPRPDRVLCVIMIESITNHRTSGEDCILIILIFLSTTKNHSQYVRYAFLPHPPHLLSMRHGSESMPL